MVLRTLTVMDHPAQFLLELRIHVGVVGEFVLRIQASFNAHRKIDFLLRVQERDFTDLLQVVFHGVSCCSGGNDALGRCIVIIAGGQHEARAFSRYFFGSFLLFLFGNGFFIFVSVFVLFAVNGLGI